MDRQTQTVTGPKHAYTAFCIASHGKNEVGPKSADKKVRAEI